MMKREPMGCFARTLEEEGEKEDILEYSKWMAKSPTELREMSTLKAAIG
jgi:hypothetical protein